MSDKNDIIVAEKLGGLTSSINNMDKKLSEFIIAHRKEHNAVWMQIDRHSKFVNWCLGASAAIAGSFGIIITWVKTKFGH